MNDHHGGIALVPPMTPYTQAEKNAHFQSIHRFVSRKKTNVQAPHYTMAHATEKDGLRNSQPVSMCNGWIHRVIVSEQTTEVRESTPGS
jgi:hypothetical protein